MSAFLNGINTAALAQFADSVRSQSAAGQAAFEVHTRWNGQTRSVARVTSYRLGEQSHARDFTIAAYEPAELPGANSAPNPLGRVINYLSQTRFPPAGCLLCRTACQ